nr:MULTISPECIES: molybdopterin converting factor subunit 1 [Staphylococcus]
MQLKERTSVKVLYFAEIKEILQTDSEILDINETMDVNNFKQRLFERHPSIQSKKFQVAVNEEFVQEEDIIQPTDTVALIPPVSGG